MRWLPLALCALLACGGKDEAPEAEPAKPTAAPVDDKRCLQLAKLCGDKAKHVDKIVEECKAGAVKEAAKGCTDKVTAVYDCYQRELCGKAEKVWTLPDLRVLAERHGKCENERTAAKSCMGQ